MSNNDTLLEISHAETQRPSALSFQMIESPESRTLTRTNDGAFVLENVTLTSVGLKVRGEVSKDEWLYVGTLLNRMEGSLQWLIGDWANGCERMWGSTYREVIEATGFKYATVRDCRYVARNVELSVRTDNLSFGHHKLLAPYADDPKQQKKLIQIAIEGKGKGKPMTIKQMREMLNGNEELFVAALANKEYRQSFNAIMKALKEEKTPKKADIERMERWVADVKKID